MNARTRWTIDAADSKSISAARHAIVARLVALGQSRDNAFAAEILIGEVLLSEITAKPQALTLEVTHNARSIILHVYSQTAGATETELRELKDGLTSKCGLPLEADISEQGVHIKVTFDRRGSMMRPLSSLWKVACCMLVERTSKRLKKKTPE